MIKNRDNRAYLDKLHYHLGVVYLKNKQPNEAENQFKKSVNSKNADRFQKVLSYEALGDIHFNKGNYLSSGLYYDSVLNFSTDQNSKRFLKIKRIRKSLDEVILYENLAQTNDSIIKLVNMTEAERKESINKIIAKLVSDKNSNPKTDSPTTNLTTKVREGTWYFYNPELVKTGIAAFQKKWGNRSLSDHWKRQNYTDLTVVNTEKNTLSDSKQTVDFYLAGIPTDKTKIDSIQQVRNEAYYKLGLIYKEQFFNNDLAINRFEKVLSFGENGAFYLPAKYHLYRIYSTTDLVKAQTLKNEIITQHPQSLYANLVQKTLQSNVVSVDENTPEKVYKTAYLLYEKEQYAEVLIRLKEAVNTYQQTDLIPKFELLKAYTIGKIEGIDSFYKALEFVAITYPNAEEGKKAEEVMQTIRNNLIKNGQ